MTRSAGRKLLCVSMLAAGAVVAAACASRPDWRAIRAREARMSPAQRRAQLNAALRIAREPHDAYIYLIELADDTSVPLLIERFRLDHPAPPPPPEPEPEPPPVDPFPYSIGPVAPVAHKLIPAFYCVHAHLVDALANATNTHRGMYYPAWKAWWDENQHKSRREWLAQGFKEAGLSPSDPIDDQFGIGLIGVLDGSPLQRHLAMNARRLLDTVPAATRVAWIEAAARSDQRDRRLGAVAALRDLHPNGHEDLLRTLASDADAGVRMNALNVLNGRLRQRPDRQARARRMSGPDKKRGSASLVLTDDLLIAAGRGGVEAFDVRSGRRRWRSEPVDNGWTMTVVKDRVMAATFDGHLIAFSPEGAVVWRVPNGGGLDAYGNPVSPRRLFAVDGHLGVLWETRLEWRDPETGRIVQTFDNRSFPVDDVDTAGRTVFVIANHQLQKMVEGRVVARRDAPAGAGVSVLGDMACVLHNYDYGSEGAEVACYDADSLALRWKQRAPRAGSSGHHVAPVQTASYVYTRSDQQLTAFRRGDGAQVWVDRSRLERFGQLLVTSRGLLVAGSDSPLDLRAPETGEVLGIWPDKPRGLAVSPSGRIAAFTTADGSIWLLPVQPTS